MKPSFKVIINTGLLLLSHLPCSRLLLLSLSNLTKGHYRYTADLLPLDRAASLSLPPDLSPMPSVVTPLNARAWKGGLETYPDRAFATYLIKGIKEGFRVEVLGNHPLFHATRNLQSAYEHDRVVQEYLDREEGLVRLQRLSSEEVATLLPLGLQISPFRVIPKRNRPGKWRLSVILSAPSGCSVNDAISRELSSIFYTSIDDPIHFIHK